MLLSGLGQIMTIPPNVRHSDYYQRVQTAAMNGFKEPCPLVPKRGFETILEIAPAPMGNAVFISSGSGRIIAGLGEDVVESSLVLFNPNGTIPVGLGTMPDGGFIGIRDKDGRSCVHLSGGPFGGLLLIKSPQGQVLFRAP
jgi:hypothetical protein